MRLIAAAMALLFSVAACAENAPQVEYKEGTHYKVLPKPIRTQAQGKIEVAEVFWYGCGHCFTFDPLLSQWKKQAADDVVVRYSPALWDQYKASVKDDFTNSDVMNWKNPMAIHARAFYTAEALGVVDKLHQPIFNALNVERKRLTNPVEIADLFNTHAGIDKETFIKTYSSFGVSSLVQRAYHNQLRSMVTGTPSVVVNGKYLITATMAGGQVEMLQVADYLVAKERAEKS